jgi:hypothetical protein
MPDRTRRTDWHYNQAADRPASGRTRPCFQNMSDSKFCGSCCISGATRGPSTRSAVIVQARSWRSSSQEDAVIREVPQLSTQVFNLFDVPP